MPLSKKRDRERKQKFQPNSNLKDNPVIEKLIEEGKVRIGKFNELPEIGSFHPFSKEKQVRR